MGDNTQMDFTAQRADLICEMISSGMSLRAVCKTDGMPSMTTVCKWLSIHDTFAEQYARACEIRAEHLFEEILEISDDSKHDVVSVDGKLVVNQEAIARARLRVDARRWMVGKMSPKKYGEKIQTEHSGSVNFTSEDANAAKCKLAAITGQK